MKTKQGFNLREMCGENIIVAEGEANIDFSNIISMNESAAFLWRKLQQLPAFTIDTMTDLMLEEYDVDASTARADCAALAATWAEAGIIEGDDCPSPTPGQRLATNLDSVVKEPAVEESAVKEPQRKSFFKRLFGK